MNVVLPELCLREQIAHVWRTVIPKVTQLTKDQTLTLNADHVRQCDGSGEALILEIYRCSAKQGFAIVCHDAQGVITRTLSLFDVSQFNDDPAYANPARKTHLCEQTGGSVNRLYLEIRDQLAFLGETVVAVVKLIVKPKRARWGETLLHFERAGMDALPIVLLIGFLLGLILAFMSATSFRQFGVEVYVADLIAIGLFRELGPLITAIILAGRSGSAFAAEIGTMKVNEELDALITFDLPPIAFLALPRIVATTLAMPFLSMFAVFAGLFGGVLVLTSIGVPAVVYWQHVIAASSVSNICFGLGKAAVFGLLVGLVGCAQGMQTSRTADGVGRAATAAVVGGLVLITLSDGIFAVLSYLLDF